MPVAHIVWMKFNDDVSGEAIEQHLIQLRSLLSGVDCVLDLSLGENFTDRSTGYTHGLIVTLPDKDSLKVYAEHPLHQKVAGRLIKDADLIALDYEY